MADENPAAGAESVAPQDKDLTTDHEKPETPKPEGEETPKPEGEDGETEKAGGDDPAVEPPKKKGGFQRKIEKLETELDYWKNVALETAASGRKDASGGEQQQQQPQDGRPRQEQFASYEDYVEAIADWKVEQRLRGVQEQSSQHRIRETFNERMNAAVGQYANFEETVGEVLSDRTYPISAAMRDVIVDSENGPGVLYHLANNRAEAQRIANLPPLAAARELGRIEAALKFPSSKTHTQAPRPPTTLKGGEVPKRPLADVDMDEYVRRRKAGET